MTVVNRSYGKTNFHQQSDTTIHEDVQDRHYTVFDDLSEQSLKYIAWPTAGRLLPPTSSS